MKNVELVLAAVGTGLQALLCLLLLARRVFRGFPIFFVFSSFSVLGTILLWNVRNDAQLYSTIYWIYDALGVFLTFFSLQEAFRSVFRNFLGLRWFRWLFPGIGILMIGVAVLRIILVPRPAYSLFTTTIIALEIGVGLLQFGIFSLFIVMVRIFHLRWRQHPVGIVFGFGIDAAGSLVAYLLRSEFGTKFDPVVRIAPAIAYIIGVTVWLATFLKAESARPEGTWATALTPEQMIAELRRHTKTVKGILGR
ncbi:MAG: hypothetical protein ACXVJL_13195 [Candidatus Angelobacter sp.]